MAKKNVSKCCCENDSKNVGGLAFLDALMSLFDLVAEEEDAPDFDLKPLDLDKMIEKVVFSDPATIVFWTDGDKTISKASHGDKFNKETGLAMAIIRKLCNNRNYNKVFNKYCK